MWSTEAFWRQMGDQWLIIANARRQVTGQWLICNQQNSSYKCEINTNVLNAEGYFLWPRFISQFKPHWERLIHRKRRSEWDQQRKCRMETEISRPPQTYCTWKTSTDILIHWLHTLTVALQNSCIYLTALWRLLSRCCSQKPIQCLVWNNR